MTVTTCVPGGKIESVCCAEILLLDCPFAFVSVTQNNESSKVEYKLGSNCHVYVYVAGDISFPPTPYTKAEPSS